MTTPTIDQIEEFARRGVKAQAAADQIVQETTTRNRSLNSTRFLCRSEVRNFLLAYAREKRTHKFTRVSEETLLAINEAVRAQMIAVVHRLPSKGKTI